MRLRHHTLEEREKRNAARRAEKEAAQKAAEAQQASAAEADAIVRELAEVFLTGKQYTALPAVDALIRRARTYVEGDRATLTKEKIEELLAPRFCECKPRDGRMPETEWYSFLGVPGRMVCSSCGFPRR